MTYSENLLNVKNNYPFAHWEESWYLVESEEDDEEPEYNEEYSPENCQEVQGIFDILLQNLIKIGEFAAAAEKEKAFETAVIQLNERHESEYFIDTLVREDLCDLIDVITIAAGLNPEDYCNGDGIADTWRKW